MKQSKVRRVLSSKIHCPFICFCKPSAAAAHHHLYTTHPHLKVKNTHTVPASAAIRDGSGQLCGEGKDVKEVRVDGRQEGESGGIRSCIRKSPPEEIERKRVQWVDDLGQELAEIKEFESSETGETENEEENRRSCHLCFIL
ncbi:PREDICTED: uncharacterized protein LOC109160100 [Ipomoea nil]|uniref:uncharacterized protein LOC109160100 n=1 Tax=Ipomoea nil TaxID=35883 RepID=UPI0009019F77|nr:PREDICTED: uncharacterized protein LOC109160100 [Ipomoea nil]XP_019163801.1 PREDICTED: uncharacterized protein LOC109160100 [Ipomoea nil]